MKNPKNPPDRKPLEVDSGAPLDVMKHLRVVLVEPLYSLYLGSVARAMANCGVDDLTLVNPKAEVNRDARCMAAHAQEVLHSARAVENFPAAISDASWAIA